MPGKFLDSLTDEERTDFLSFCEKKVFLTDQEIIRKGETERDLFLIQTGSATASDNWDEDSVPLAIFSEWDVFGEMSFLEGSPRSATVIASEDSVVFSISWEKFSRFLEEKPAIGVKLLLRFTDVLIKRLQFIDEAFTTIAVANRDMKKNMNEMRKVLKG
jgi:CRP-like cAMP-binding protein